MARKKKTEKKVYVEPTEIILTKMDNFDERIRKMYKEMKIGERYIIGKNIQLVKLPCTTDFHPLLAIDLIPIKKYTDSTDVEKECRYRYPLNITSSIQYDTICNLLLTESLDIMIEVVNNINTETKVFNDSIYIEKKAKAEKKRVDKEEKNNKKLEEELDDSTEEEN